MDVDLQQCLRGEKPAWDLFVEKFSPAIYAAARAAFARHVPVPRQEDIQDAVQNVFVRLLQNDFHLLRSYDPSRAGLATWLSVIARSVALDHLRRPVLKAVEPAGAGPAAPEEHSSCVDIPPDVLSPRQSLVLHLLFDRGMEVEQVAGLLGVDPQTVRSTKHKAIAALRRHFKVT